MSMSSLETLILIEMKEVLCNRGIKKKDILEWSTGPVKAESDDEIVLSLPNNRVSVCVNKSMDKRKSLATEMADG